MKLSLQKIDRLETLKSIAPVLCIIVFLYFTANRIMNYGPTSAIKLLLLPAVIIVLIKPICIAYLVTIINFTNADFLFSFYYEGFHAANYSAFIPFFFFPIFFMSYMIKRRNIFNPITKAAWALLLFYLAYFIMGAINRPHYDTMIKWFKANTFFFLNFFVFFFAVTSHQRLRIILNIILFSTIVAALLNISEFIGVIDISTRISLQGLLRTSSIFFNANVSAYNLCLGYLASFYLPKVQRMKFLIIIRVILFLGILVTFSRSGIIIYFVITLFQIYTELSSATKFLKKFLSASYIILLISIIILLISILFPFFSKYIYLTKQYLTYRFLRPETYQSRSNLLKAATTVIAESPFWGHGITGSYQLMLSSHNYFTHILISVGFIGLIFWIYFLVAMYLNIKKIQDSFLRHFLLNFLIIFLILSLVSNSPITRPSAVMMGIVAINWNAIYKKNNVI